MSENSNEAAFSRPASEGSKAKQQGYGEQLGLTKRELFAAIAMHAFILQTHEPASPESVGNNARLAADKTLKELEDNPL